MKLRAGETEMDVPNVTLQPACFCGMFDVLCRLTHGVVWSISDGVIHRRNETYVMKQLENYMQLHVGTHVNTLRWRSLERQPGRRRFTCIDYRMISPSP